VDVTLFDSHCHLTDERFHDDVDAVLDRAVEAGVHRLVTVASDVADAAAARELAEAHEGVWSTAGVHPHVADTATEDAFARVRELAAGERVVALGETGLDYYYENAPRAAQRKAFERHLVLARELDLPVVVHARDADDDAAATVRDAADVRGVLHCFSSGETLLAAGLEAGWYVSFSGLVTFASYDGAAFVRAVPPDRLLVETDSPYLAPVPRRGKRNEPAYVRRVVETVAGMREEPVEGVAGTTRANANRLYRLEP